MEATPLARLDWFTGDETFDRILDELPRAYRRLVAECAAQPLALATPRLRLRELAPSDLPLLIALLADARHRRYVLPHQFGESYARRQIAGAMIAMRSAARRSRVLAIEMRADGALAGTCTLSLRGRLEPRAFIGWEIARSFANCGIATESGRVLIEHAVQDLGMRSVIGDCDMRNHACVAVLRRLGMQPVALRRWNRWAMALRYGANLPFARYRYRAG